MEARRCPGAGASTWRRGAALHPQPQRHHRPVARRGPTPCVAMPGGDLVLDGEVLGLLDDGSPRTFQDTMRRSTPTPGVLLRRLARRRQPVHDEALSGPARDPGWRPCPRRRGSRRSSRPTWSRPKRSWARDRGRPRRGDGEGPRAALRGRAPGQGVAQGQAGAHVRPGGPGGRVGPRAPARVAVEPAPRCSRPDAGGFVMVGKTFKGMTDEMLRWQTERFSELSTR